MNGTIFYVKSGWWQAVTEPLRNQITIGHSISLHNAPQRVHENVLIVAVVEAPFQFFEVAI